MSAGPTVRRPTDPADPAVAAFGRLQERAYPDPDSLIPASLLPGVVAGDWGEGNFLLVAEQAGAVIGGALFHHLAAPNTGFSSFLAVDLAHRGRGVARRLHQARFAALDAAAQAAGRGPEVRGVFIDVVAPERLSPAELAREAAVGSDPVARRRVFQALGFRRVPVRYEQPVGGPDGGPITTLDLLFCPRHPAEATLNETVPTELVVQTLLAYWGGWLGEQRTRRHAEELRARAGTDLMTLEPAG